MNMLEGLNDRQREAVLYGDGPMLILAGAGSGKTRVLTNRIAWLIHEKQVKPWNILAITFTNKAAGEMRERVNHMVGFGAESIWVSTFHSMCCRILRRHIDRLGYTGSFVIYDTDDQKTLMKDVCRRLDINTKLTKERALLNRISAAKNELIDADDYAEMNSYDYMGRKVSDAYAEYQRSLKKNNALDFDDLLMLTVELFERCPEILASYKDQFQYILVDEYQDTNTAQFRMIELLAGKGGNLCVVGDDDQSIYRFRGANIRNILSFEEVYPKAKVVRLEQNYRSTQSILDTANSVIANNVGRKEKRLWTDNGRGKTVVYRQFESGFEEAEFIADEIRRRTSSGESSLGDFAVLYRTNAQSRVLEEKLLLANVPYQIIGGVNFYARKEIKDILSYLKILDNPSDDLAVRRIINVPRRGIGAATINKLQTMADEQGVSFYSVLSRANTLPGFAKGTVAKLEGFMSVIEPLRAQAEEGRIVPLLKELLERTGYVEDLKAEGSDEAKDRIGNIDELISKAAVYDQSEGENSLNDFLSEVALVAEIDNLEDGSRRVTLMTLHSAKGLEFPVVYLTGMEENTFPSYMSLVAEDSEEEVEEERRLCYVGITRAMKELTLTSAQRRMVRGQMQYNMVSRFIEEIPPELLDSNGSAYLAGMSARGSLSSSERSRMEVSRGYSGREYRRMDEYGPDFGENSFGSIGKAKKKTSALPKYDMSQFKVKKADQLEYTVGDRVRHIKFGEGTVRDIHNGEKDFEVTVNFDKAGVKKMFAAFAKLKKI